jgi:hypothetical protein
MYKAPVEEILFTLKHVAGLSEDLTAGIFGDLDEDLVDAIVGEAGRFATEEMAPLAEIGGQAPAAYAERRCAGNVEFRSMAFGIAPTLTMGAVEALVAHGSEA